MTTNLFQLPTETVQDVDAAIDELDYYKIQFAALAPTSEMWAAHPWANWYSIDPGGKAWFSNEEPIVEFRYDVSQWNVRNTTAVFKPYVISTIPVGIDWRLCKWQRPIEEEAEP